MQDILGIDCGDVILFTFGGQVPGSLTSLRELAANGRFKEIHVISKALPTTRLFFTARLALIDFWNYTGIPQSHLHFCTYYEDKDAICATLGVTHFVDDRLQVLRALTAVPHRYLLRADGAPRARETDKYGPVPNGITPVRSWPELQALL